MPMKVVLEIDAENELVHSGFWLWVKFWLETLFLYEVGNNSYSYTRILAIPVEVPTSLAPQILDTGWDSLVGTVLRNPWVHLNLLKRQPFVWIDNQ